MKTDLPAYVEVVLPSGRFARCRPITVADVLAIATLPGLYGTVGLAARCVTVDDQALDVNAVVGMGWAEFLPISRLLNRQIADAGKTSDGVA